MSNTITVLNQLKEINPDTYKRYIDTLQHYMDNFMVFEGSPLYDWYEAINTALNDLTIMLPFTEIGLGLHNNDFEALRRMVVWYEANVIQQGISELNDTNLHLVTRYHAVTVVQKPKLYYLYAIYNPLTENPYDIAYVGMSENPSKAVTRFIAGMYAAGQEVMEWQRALVTTYKEGFYVVGGSDMLGYFNNGMTRHQILEATLAIKRGNQKLLEWGILQTIMVDAGQNASKAALYATIERLTQEGHNVLNKKAGRKPKALDNAELS